MKKIIFLCVVCSVLLMCACQPLNNAISGDMEPIVSKTNPSASATDPTVWEDLEPKHFVLISEKYFTSNGVLYDENIYTYDDYGRMTSWKHGVYGRDEKDNQLMSFVEKYAYNEEGYLSEIDTDVRYRSDVTYEYEYNTDGTVRSYTVTNAEKPTPRYFEYDRGLISRVYYLDQDGNEKQIRAFTYDDHGRLKLLFGKHVQLATTTFYYDEQGRISEIWGSEIVYFYYENDLLVRMAMADGRRWDFTYKNGRISGISFASDEIDAQVGPFAPKTYELDQYGNIIKIQYASGSRYEYEYQELETEPISDSLRYTYFGKLNEVLWEGHYYWDPISYALPHIQF